MRKHSRPPGEGRCVPLTARQARELIWALKRWERRQERVGKRRIRGVGHIGLAAFEYMCWRAVNARGRLDDLAYERIAAVIGHARSAVVAAMARLKAHGWLDWFRRFRPTGEAGRRGPQVEQDVNFYWLRAPTEALIKLGIRIGAAPPPDDHDEACAAGEAANAEAALQLSPLGAALDRLGAAVRQRETS